MEKREGTLGLLFLTDLKGHDVVLGKLVATSVRGFYALLAVFPVLAIPLLLGGITNGEFWRVVLVLMDTFLFSLAIGILGSALTRDLQWAMAANIFLLLLLMAVPAACMFALDYFAPGLRKLPQLLFSCPVYAFYLCDDSRYVLMPNHYWWTVGVLHGLSLLLLLVAGWVAPRSWQDRPSRAQKSRWRDLWHAWMRGPAPERAAFRKRTLDTNAFYWLAARARFRTVHVWTFLGCMAIWWLVCWALLGRYWLDPSVAVLTGLLLNFAFKVWVTIEAGRQLAEDKRTGALELLLSLPLTTQDILRGQLLAIRRQFLWPLVVALGVGVLLMLMVRQRAPGWENQATWLGGMAMFVVDLIALAWVGMWRALVARSHNRATISTLLDVLILPWALFAGVAGTGQVWFGLALGQSWDPGWRFYLRLWMGLGLAVDLVFGLAAWWQLRTRFRELALRRFNPAPSRLSRRLSLEPTAGAETAGARTFLSAATPERSPTPGTPAAPSLPQPKNVRAHPRLALASCLALVLAGLAFMVFRPRSPSTPAIIVSLTQSNAPVQVFAGQAGVLLILPDGSIWRWGTVRGGGFPAAMVPQQVGTNQDWIAAAGGFPNLVGLRRDGTLWEWGPQLGSPTGAAGSDAEPWQVGPGYNWTSVASAGNHSAALRADGTLWVWGGNTAVPQGIGTGLRIVQPVQVGTNEDWAAVCCLWDSTLALRRDGTLWTWGRVPLIGTGWMNFNEVSSPTQVCLESNWTGFTGGSWSLVWNRAGELWEPFHGTPNPETPAALNLRLVVPHAVSGRFATAWCDEPRAYEVRADGTLWERTQPLSSLRTPVGEWHRVGKRSDWVSLWSTGTTAVGLTADGTLWTWGLDPAGQGVRGFVSQLKLARARLMALVGPGPRPMPPPVMPAFQKQPRPLLRMVLTNSTH